MKKPITRAAVIAGAALLASTLLTGCAGEKHTFSGLEVSGLDKTIEALDASWAQHRANGTAANVADGSRCFVQSGSDGILAEKALCGPVHYLGDDDATWDSVRLHGAPSGKDQVTVSAEDSFSKDKPNANTKLYRTDGKTPGDGAGLAEPDAPAAEAEKALWNADTSHSNPSGTPGTPARIFTPDGFVEVVGPKVADRIGSSENRLKAGDNHKFATVGLTFRSQSADPYSGSSEDTKTELAFTSGGKTYPVGKARNGVLSMAVPGDGKDLALAVVYGDMNQTVTLADGKVHSTATALYDGIPNSGLGKTSEVVLGKEQTPGTLSSTLESSPIRGTRSGYDKKAGWAPEGKAWLRITGNLSLRGPRYWFNDGNSIGYSKFDNKTSVKSATVSNVSGTAFKGELKADTSNDSSGWFSGGVNLDLLFVVPANTADFKVSLVLNTAGKRDGDSHPEVPATVSQDYIVPAAQITLDGN